MELQDLASSIETSIERVTSAVWNITPEQRKRISKTNLETLEKNSFLSDEEKQKRAIKKQPVDKSYSWTSNGLALNNNQVPKTLSSALNKSLSELLKGILRGLLLGFSLKGGLSFVFGILQAQKPKKIVKSVFSQDVWKFTRFAAAFIGLFRGVNVLAVYYYQKDRQRCAALAATIASVAVLLDDRERRRGISLYLFVRAVDVLIKRLVREKHLPYISWFEYFVFGVANMPIMYGLISEPELLDKGYYKWMLGMCDQTHEGLNITVRQRGRHFAATGEILPFQPCNPHYHEGPCTIYCVKDWFLGLRRAGKVYLPVHLVPLLLFKYRALFQDPSSVLMHSAKALLSSCMFLSSYQTIVKVNCCFWRNTLQWDYELSSLAAGMLTSFACLFERPSRVSELMMYCLPKGMEITYAYLVKRGRLKYVKNGELPLFAFAAAVLLSGYRVDFKPIYHKALCFLVSN